MDHKIEAEHGARIRDKVIASTLDFTWVERTNGLSHAMLDNRELSDLYVLVFFKLPRISSVIFDPFGSPPLRNVCEPAHG